MGFFSGGLKKFFSLSFLMHKLANVWISFLLARDTFFDFEYFELFSLIIRATVLAIIITLWDKFKDLKLVDYKVRILNIGTEAVTRVSIESTD